MNTWRHINISHANFPADIETSKFICIADQFTGFYMRGSIAMKNVKGCLLYMWQKTGKGDITG